MKDFKGTKGEWLRNGSFVEAKNGLTITRAYYGVAETQEEVEANAQLIASAPELLKALQTCLRRIKNESHEPFAIIEAENAINKAIG